MSLAFLAFSIRRPLPILPFLAPSWSWPWNPVARAEAEILFRSSPARALSIPSQALVKTKRTKLVPKPEMNTNTRMRIRVGARARAVPRGRINNKYEINASRFAFKRPTGPRDSENILADEVAKEDDDEEGMLQKISELCATYSDNKFRTLIPLILSEGHSSKAMAKSWAKLDPKERRYGFRLIAGYLLKESCPQFCTRLVECCCIHDTHVPGPEDISLVMELVVRLEFRMNRTQHRKLATPPRGRIERKSSRYIDLLLAMLRIDYGGVLSVRQSTIYRLLQGASLDEAERLYDGLKEANVILSTDTMLHFIHRLSEPHKWAKAYSILENLVQDRTRNLRVPQVWKGFQKLFYGATFIGEEESSKVIRMMIDSGIGPGLTSYNILMSKAVRDGDEQSLTRIFRQMFEVGLKPSMVTFGLLHNFYKRQGKELERIKVVRDVVKLNRNLNQIIATDILGAKIKTSEHYYQILQEYLAFFNPAPLIPLGIAPAELDNPEQQAQRKLYPSHILIAAMVHAFVVRESDPMAIWACYKRYRKLTNTEESEHRRLLDDAGCYIPNSYMLALGRHEDTLRHAAVVMEDMLKFDSSVHPNVYSWSILLYAMAKAGKIKQAEQVLGAMRRKGIKPNAVTWASLFTGYVKIGGLRQAGGVLRRMIDDNVEPNSKTMELLSSILDLSELKKGMMLESKGQGAPEEQREREHGSTEMTDEEIDILLMRKRDGDITSPESPQMVEPSNLCTLEAYI